MLEKLSHNKERSIKHVHLKKHIEQNHNCVAFEYNFKSRIIISEEVKEITFPVGKTTVCRL